MKRAAIFVGLLLWVLLAGAAFAAGSGTDFRNYRVADGRYSQTFSGQPIGSKVDPDTIYMMGGPNRTDGKFQTGPGGVLPDRQGWIGVDLTFKSEAKWNISDWNGRAVLDPSFSPNHVMWCGEMLDPCPGGDPPQGYMNNYDEWLDWRGVVADNTIPTDVTVTAILNNDCEPGYDLLRFEVNRSTGQDEIWNSGGGTNVLVDFNQSFTVGVADYVGPDLNEIHLRFHGTSDISWSDGDCQWPSYGHSQVDNIRVTTNNGVNTYDTFESATTNWAATLTPACGDFSFVWPGLIDLDPCSGPSSPAVAFIDDGIVVPGTGGSPGLTWTYGPGGYVVNGNGGLAGPPYHVHNEVWSPPMAWPDSAEKQYTGCQYNFCVYSHLPLSNGIFYIWRVRDSTDGGVTWGNWKGPEFVYYGPMGWFDIHNTVTPLLRSNRTHVRVALGIWDYGWIWGYHSNDVTPAPYFDNVRVLAYSVPGPAIAARDIDLFQCSNFPAIGTIDYANLGNNSIRLDMANNISPPGDQRNDPGDSIVVSVVVTRPGATLQGVPKLYYKLRPNPLFDAFRTSGLPNEGFLNGDTTKTILGTVVANSWRWDFPDSNFFFPGDMIHYYIEAQDNQGGSIGTTRMPADTTGFCFGPPLPGADVPWWWWWWWWWLHSHGPWWLWGLPTMASATPGDQPPMLFWDDAAYRGGEDEWIGALSNLGYEPGKDYDLFYTNGASAGLGNGLGGRATSVQLAGYSTMLYTSGDLGSYTLSNGDFRSDAGNDVAVMTDWLAQGGKKWFCTGDDLANGLGSSGAAALAFRNTFLPMTFVGSDVRPLIQNQINPTVVPVPGNPVGLSQSYIAYGGCQVFNKFDAVQATTGSTRIATFQQLSGSAYPYAAALYVPNAGAYGDQVVYMPYDFMNIYSIPNTGGTTLSKRAQVLSDILTFFGQTPSSPTTAIREVPALAFSAKNFPNPFNPSTKIEYSLPRDGQLSIKIFNVRGELVRTLVNEPTKAGPGSVTWQGDDDRGQKVASGVYFYQVKSAGSEIFKKMTLVK